MGAATAEKKRRERGPQGGTVKAKKKKRKKREEAPADRGKEAEQRKSIVRLLIEKWGRFMGYRQTELSASLSRRHLARDRPADIASLSPFIPFAPAPSLARAPLAPPRRGARLPRARARP